MNTPASPSQPFGPVHAVLWMVTAFLWMAVGAIVMGAIRQESMTDMVSLGALSAAVFLLTSAMLTSRYPAGDSVKLALGLRPTSPALLPLGLLGGALAQVPAEGVLHLESLVWPRVEEAAAARALSLEPRGAVHAVLLVTVAAFLVPFAEEAFFRGAVYGALRRAGRPGLTAGLITAVGFALSHIEPTLLLPIFLVGSYLTFLRVVSGSLWVSFAAHIGFNLVPMLVIVLRLPEEQFDLLAPGWQIGAGAGLFATVLLTLWLGRGERPRASRREEAIPVDA